MRKIEGKYQPRLKKLLYTLGFLLLVSLACQSTSSFEKKEVENEPILTNPLGTNIFNCGELTLYYNDDLSIMEDPLCETNTSDDGYLETKSEKITLRQSSGENTIIMININQYEDVNEIQIEFDIKRINSDSANISTPNCATNFTNNTLPTSSVLEYNIPHRDQFEASCSIMPWNGVNDKENDWKKGNPRFDIVRKLPATKVFPTQTPLPLNTTQG